MLILTQTTDAVGIITLNHPAKRNALSRALVEDMMDALADFRKNGIRAVVIRTTPDAKVWSAGHDVGEFSQGEDPAQHSDPLEGLARMIPSFPAPVLAMVHGSVWGGATDLVLTCDLIIGDETSSFAITPANLGLPFPTAGLLHFLRRLPLNLVKEMFFTAAPVKAEDAAKWGILNHLVPAADLERFTYDMARLIATKAPLAISALKEQLRLLAEATSLTPEAFERIQELRQRIYQSADYLEGLRSFQEKRKPVFTGK